MMTKQSFISIALATLTSIMLSGCGSASSRESVQADFIQFASQFVDYSYVDWDTINKVNTEQYTADWDDSLQQIIDSTKFPTEIATSEWTALRNAKALTHKESLPLRSFLDKETTAAIDSLEAGFDKVFKEIISQEYYMRLPSDCFDEVIPPLLDDMVRTIAKNFPDEN